MIIGEPLTYRSSLLWPVICHTGLMRIVLISSSHNCYQGIGSSLQWVDSPSSYSLTIHDGHVHSAAFEDGVVAQLK